MNNLAKFSLRTWVFIVGFLPTLIIGTALGGYFTLNRFEEVKKNLMTQGHNIITPIAVAAELPMSSKDRETAKKLISLSQLKNSQLISSIAIFDENNQIFVTSNFHRDFENMRFQGDINNIQENTVNAYGDNAIFYMPIYSDPFWLNNFSKDEPQIIGYVSILLKLESAILAQHRAAMAAFIIVFLGLQLNIFFTLRMFKYISNPVNQMVNVVKKIQQGELDARVSGPLVGELDHLRLGINSMASSLNDYHHELQLSIDQATQDLRETLEQFEIQNVELDIAKKKAEEGSKIKSEFLANMSHELRTPLNGVLGFSRQLLKTPLYGNQQEYIRTIEHSAGNLLKIINDILDFSKLEAGKMVLEQIPFNFNDCIDDTIKLLSPIAHDKQLELIIDIDPNLPENLTGDSLRIAQIINNLVGNAIKFTKEGSITFKVEVVNISPEEIDIKAEIIDTGIGISEAQSKQLFKAFGQGDSSISRSYGGTGLGLVITKHLVNRMGGQIGFSRNTYNGTTFWFSLKLKTGPFQIDESKLFKNLKDKVMVIIESKSASNYNLSKRCRHLGLNVQSFEHMDMAIEYIENTPKVDFVTLSIHKDQQYTQSIKTIQKYCEQMLISHDNQDIHQLQPLIRADKDSLVNNPISHRQLTKSLLFRGVAPIQTIDKNKRINAHVLCVDDNPANLKLIKTLVLDHVTEVTTAENGEQAISQASENIFDLILMDIQMPIIDGLQATEAIRKDSKNTTTPIIAVTAHADAQEQQKIISYGIEEIITKPISEARISKMLYSWLNKPNVANTDSLNWALALKQANNKPELAKDMILMLLDSLAQASHAIEANLQNDDASSLIEVVHKLHGASCYAGTEQLQKICRQLEQSLKAGRTINQLEPEILELLDEITNIESSAPAFMANLNVEIN